MPRKAKSNYQFKKVSILNNHWCDLILTILGQEKIKALQEVIQARRPIVSTLNDTLLQENAPIIDSLSQDMVSQTALSQSKEDNSDALAFQQCRDLTQLFCIRRRKVRRGFSKKDIRSTSSSPSSDRPISPHIFETSIAFTFLPDFAVLPRYPHTMINASTERLAYYCFYIAYYLHLTLPYTILTPQKQAPFIRICENSRHIRRAVVLRNSVKTTVQTTPTEFESYASGLAMLALNLSYIAVFLGCSPPTQITLDSVVQVDKMILTIHENLLTSTLPQLIENSPFWQFQRQQLKPGPMPRDDCIAMLPDLEDVVDSIITRNFLEINGGSAEWNLVDFDKDE